MPRSLSQRLGRGEKNASARYFGSRPRSRTRGGLRAPRASLCSAHKSPGPARPHFRAFPRGSSFLLPRIFQAAQLSASGLARRREI